METVKIDYYNRTGIIKLDNGTTNAINSRLVYEFSEALEKMRVNPDVNSVVVTSSKEKFFSIGFDIPYLYNLSKKDFTKFYKSFNQLCISLFSFPKPTIAALTGHTVAGGCVIAICFDYRFIADERKLMGMNEIKLGIPAPYPCDCILRQLVGNRNARDILYSGDFYDVEKAHELGLVDRILPISNVLSKSIEEADKLGSHPNNAFRKIKQISVEPVKQQILDHLDEHEQRFIAAWHTHAVRKILKEAIEKF